MQDIYGPCVLVQIVKFRKNATPGGEITQHWPLIKFVFNMCTTKRLMKTSSLDYAVGRRHVHVLHEGALDLDSVWNWGVTSKLDY